MELGDKIVMQALEFDLVWYDSEHVKHTTYFPNMGDLVEFAEEKGLTFIQGSTIAQVDSL